MVITVSAIVFLIGILLLTVVGGRILRKKSDVGMPDNREKCSLCRNVHDKNDLVLRELGDYKLLYFCRACIIKLYSDMGIRN